MCGGLARWLRAFGYDTFYRDAIEDRELVELALREDRLLISSDDRIFERKLLTSGQVRSLPLPRGLPLMKQVEYVARRLRLSAGEARCTLCNGQLRRVRRADVGHLVPARSLVWAKNFFQCSGCQQVYWDGTHWQKIERWRGRLRQWASEQASPET
jgi:uncharacterized protein with PIN domain